VDRWGAEGPGLEVGELGSAVGVRGLGVVARSEVVGLDSGAVVRDLEAVARLAVAARDLVAGARGWVVAAQRIQRHLVQKSLLFQKRFRIGPVPALRCCRPTKQRHAALRFRLPTARSSPSRHFEFPDWQRWKLLSSFVKDWLVTHALVDSEFAHPALVFQKRRQESASPSWGTLLPAVGDS
jgi:hypothetical protein